MSHRTSVRTWLGAAAAGSAMLLVGVPSAGADQRETPAEHEVAAADAAAAEAYWTPERMRAAAPADVPAAERAAAPSPVASGTPRAIPGHGPQAGRDRGDQGSGNGQGHGQVQGGGHGNGPDRASAEAPVPHIGKVFFTLGGQDYVCSGNAVVSGNESTVATAGHCVNEGPGEFATRWIFVPAYDNGNAPYGEWAATSLLAPSAWTDQGDISHDTGFAVVDSEEGSTLTDTVGASGVAFNQPTGEFYTAYGYPAASPYDGQSLVSCAGQAGPDPYGQSDSQGIECDMTGGSSGGPWFLGTDSSGMQNSVNSFGYTDVPGTMFGPYWGSAIEETYLTAQE
ncbi:trypsin-like serine peptidase [Georgenia deserti]|uniref:Trypsin-like serine peptidase n=1 Tax=Georgenia deserti TaxID=2093781 RepID=A0ABW4KYK2_9MICO